MHSTTVIVAQADCIAAEHLAANLHTHFREIVVARDMEELRHLIQYHRADFVVLDLELAEFSEIAKLAREFHDLGIVCTHRVPDEEMWRACLNVGALDCCCLDDVYGIVRAARSAPRVMTAHAA